LTRKAKHTVVQKACVGFELKRPKSTLGPGNRERTTRVLGHLEPRAKSHMPIKDPRRLTERGIGKNLVRKRSMSEIKAELGL